MQGKFKVNMDRLPILIKDGSFVLGQSKSIEKYLSHTFGFMGSTLEETGTIDMIYEHVRDIRQKLVDAKAGKTGDAAEEAKAKFYATELPKWLAKLEHVVGSPAFAVGSKRSLADVAIYFSLTETFDNAAGVAKALTGLPKLSGILAAVTKDVAGWVAARPVTAF